LRQTDLQQRLSAANGNPSRFIFVAVLRSSARTWRATVAVLWSRSHAEKSGFRVTMPRRYQRGFSWIARLSVGDRVALLSRLYSCHNAPWLRPPQGRGASVWRAFFPVRSGNQSVEPPFLASVTRRTVLRHDHVTTARRWSFRYRASCARMNTAVSIQLVRCRACARLVPLDLLQTRPPTTCSQLANWVFAPKGAGFVGVREDQQGESASRCYSPATTPASCVLLFSGPVDWTARLNPSAWICGRRCQIDWMTRYALRLGGR